MLNARLICDGMTLKELDNMSVKDILKNKKNGH